MAFVYKAFTADDVLAMVNTALTEAGRQTRAVDVQRSHDSLIEMTGNRGQRLVAQLWGLPGNSLAGLRSVHQVRDKRKSFSFLINGQAFRNLKALSVTEEAGPLWSPPRAQVEQFMREVYALDETRLENMIAREAEINPTLLDNHTLTRVGELNLSAGKRTTLADGPSVGG